jgi:hypothetical protein
MRSVGDVVGTFKPSVLVIDTEGMEEELLAACPLSGVRALVVEVHPDVIGTDGIARLGQHLRDCGFVLVDRLSTGDTQTWQRAGGQF